MFPPVAHVYEKVMASKMLSSAAGNASAELASFSGWLITGFAAAFGLLLVNIDAVAQFIEPQRLGGAIVLFLFAVVLHVIQRWLAAITAGSVAAGKEAEAAGAAAGERGEEIDFNLVFSEVEHATYRPARWLVQRSFRKLQSGDLAAGGRMQFKVAQWQAFAVLVQLLLSVGAACIVALGLKA